MPEPDWNRIAAGAYEAYAQVVSAEAHPLPTPAWDELGPRYQEGWKEAVRTVEQALTEAKETQ